MTYDAAVDGVTDDRADLSTHKQLTQALNYQAGFGEMVATIAASFITVTADKMEETLRQALREIGQFSEAERSYLIVADAGQGAATYEWCAEGVATGGIGRQEVLSSADLYFIDGEGSVINIPLIAHGRLLGYLGLESLKREKFLPRQYIELVKIVSVLFVGIIERHQSEVARLRTETCTDRRHSEACDLSMLDIAVKVQEERPLDEIVDLACQRIDAIFNVPLLWVGHKQPDGSVRLSLSARESKEYMEGAVLRWDDSVEGRGITGTAIRTGKLQLMNIEDSRMLLWRERLTEYSVTSGAAFPLKVGNSIFGALTVYTDNPDFWDKWTIIHLTNFAKQLALAIQATSNRQRLKLLTTGLEFAANAIIITSRNGDIEWVNPAFLRRNGYGAADALTSNARILEASQHPRSFYKAIRQHVLQGRIWQGEIVIRCKDGSQYTSETTITPVRDEVGAITNFIAIIQDITQRKQAESEMLEARAILARNERLNALGTMAAGIAHEINQPLNSLKVLADGMLYWYQQGSVPEISEAMESFQEISKQAERIDAIIKHMRYFIRGSHLDKRVPCSINQAVEDSLLLIGSQFSAHNIMITTDLAVDLPPIIGGSTQLEQIIINLLVNAKQALDTVEKPDKRISIVTGKTKATAFLTISDNGAGISKELKSKIFDPFFTTKSAGEGMGLGLSIVHSIVTSYGGQIRVEDNKPAGGVTFRMEFPVALGKRKGEITL